MKVLAVGDIHTKLWIVDEIRKIADNYDAVVFCGDYADDFNTPAIRSIETWKELRSLSHSKPHVKLVQGNHDYIYVNKTPTLQTGFDQITQLMINDPENKGLKEWLQNLPVIEHIDGVMYSHAGVLEAWAERYNGKESIETLWNDLSPLWVRPQAKLEYRSYQVFGHTPSETCWEVQPNVWCIDTFSTHPDGKPYGDHTVLEIVDGKEFRKVEIKNGQSNNSTNRKSV